MRRSDPYFQTADLLAAQRERRRLTAQRRGSSLILLAGIAGFLIGMLIVAAWG